MPTLTRAFSTGKTSPTIKSLVLKHNLYLRFACVKHTFVETLSHCSSGGCFQFNGVAAERCDQLPLHYHQRHIDTEIHQLQPNLLHPVRLWTQRQWWSSHLHVDCYMWTAGQCFLSHQQQQCLISVLTFICPFVHPLFTVRRTDGASLHLTCLTLNNSIKTARSTWTKQLVGFWFHMSEFVVTRVRSLKKAKNTAEPKAWTNNNGQEVDVFETFWSTVSALTGQIKLHTDTFTSTDKVDLTTVQLLGTAMETPDIVKAHGEIVHTVCSPGSNLTGPSRRRTTNKVTHGSRLVDTF